MHVEEHNGSVWLRVRVQPKASRSQINVTQDGRIRVTVTAPPAHGAANAAVRTLMAKTLRVPKSSIELLKGEKAREKTLAVAGLSMAQVRSRLDANRPKK